MIFEYHKLDSALENYEILFILVFCLGVSIQPSSLSKPSSRTVFVCFGPGAIQMYNSAIPFITFLLNILINLQKKKRSGKAYLDLAYQTVLNIK